MSIARERSVQHFAALTAVLFSLAGPPVVAGDALYTEQKSVTVRYGDLNLSAQAGVDVLHQRLRMAAKQVCGYRDFRILQSVQSWKQCYNTALQNALIDAGMASLVARMQEQGRSLHGQGDIASAAK